MKIKKYFINLVLVLLAFGMGILYSNISKKAKLDDHYLSSLKVVKERLVYGSEVDTRKELEDYEDKLELHMHLDGYNDAEITSMKIKALSEVAKKRKQ